MTSEQMCFQLLADNDSADITTDIMFRKYVFVYRLINNGNVSLTLYSATSDYSTAYI